MQRYNKKWKIIVPLLFVSSLLFAAETVTLDIPVTQDMEEIVANGKIRNDAILNLGHDRIKAQLVGLRFNKVALPQGVRITKAYLEFTARKNAEGDADFTVLAEESGNAAVLKRKRHNLSSRTLMQTQVQWNGLGEWVRNQKYRSEDITPLIQDLVEQEGWEKGNAILLLIKPDTSCEANSCQRMAKAKRWRGRGAPILHIAYSEGPSKEPIVETPPKNWYIRLVAEDPARGLKAGDAQLGQLEEEDAASKHSLKSFGHFGSNYLDVIFKDPEGTEAGSYKSNFHTLQDSDQWRFSVQTNDSNAEIILTWRGIYVLDPYSDGAGRTRYRESRSLTNPLGTGMKLVDTQTGEEVPAFVNGKAQVYVFSMDGQTERSFEWHVETPQAVAPQAQSATSEDASSEENSEEGTRMMARSFSRKLPAGQLSTMKARAMRLDARAMRKRIKEERKKHFDITQPPVLEGEMRWMRGKGEE
jgi:hypothetical protein